MVSNKEDWQKLLLSFSQRPLKKEEVSLLAKLISDRIPVSLPRDEEYSQLSRLVTSVEWAMNDYIHVEHQTFFKDIMKECELWLQARKVIANPRTHTYRSVPCDPKFTTEWLLKLQLYISPSTIAGIASLGESNLCTLNQRFNEMLDSVEKEEMASLPRDIAGI